MKKIAITVLCCIPFASSYAQRHYQQHAAVAVTGAAKPTGAGDTLVLSNIADTASLYHYRLGSRDSGYVSGTNYWGDKAFAERYSFNGHDSSMRVIGAYAQFGGKVNPATTKSLSFHIWGQGNPFIESATKSFTGFPDRIISTPLTVPFTELGIGPGDTLKKFMFPTPSVALNGAFFLGFSLNYNFTALNGDTISIARTSPNSRNLRWTITLTITGTDTLMSTNYIVQNATQWSDNTWHDNYADNDSLLNNLAIYPIVIIGSPTAVTGFTKNNLTLLGNYPNPATTQTNVRFSLANQTDVTLQVRDMSDHLVYEQTLPKCTTGEHTLPLNTSTLPAGNYTYLIRTADGAGIASMMSITR